MKIEWHIEKRKLSELKQHKDNPRLFTYKGLNDLENSIENIGYAQPININIDGTVLSGHARLSILQKQNKDLEIDVYVPNRELNEKEQREILIRMNANIAGEWNFDSLMSDFNRDNLLNWGITNLNDIGSLLNDLDNDAFSEKFENEKEFFGITFSIDKKYEEQINQKLNFYGKEYITALIKDLIFKNDTNEEF